MADNEEKKYRYPSVEEMKKMVDKLLPQLPTQPPHDPISNFYFNVMSVPDNKPFAGGYPLPNIIQDERIPPDTIIVKKVRVGPPPVDLEDALKDFDVIKFRQWLIEDVLLEPIRQQELKNAKVIEQDEDGKWRKAE